MGKKKIHWKTIAILAGGITIFFWISNFFFARHSDSNLIGDAFGIVNSLFSGLAFVGIVITIWMQKEQLEIQQEEIEDNKFELIRQRFEVSFFNLLSEHRKQARSAKTTTKYNNELTGSQSIAKFVRFLYINKCKTTTFSPEKELEQRKDLYDACLKDTRYEFNLHVKYTVAILNYIDKTNFSRITETNKKIKLEYMFFFLSQTSKDELILYAHFAMYSKKFRALINNLSLFNGFKHRNLLPSDNFIKLFNRSAFYPNSSEWLESDFPQKEK